MKIDLRGPHGNAFVVLGKTEQLLKAQGRSADEIEAIMNDATSSDYEHLLDVCAKESGITYVGRPRRSKKSQGQTTT